MKTRHILLFSLFILISVYSSSCNNKKQKQEPEAKQTPQQSFLHPEWCYNATIYEVNIRQYTPEGTFKAFGNHLPRLKQLGVDILWFMPVQTIGKEKRKGSLGSYYSIQNYTEVNPQFGNLDEFKDVVKKAHDSGLKVILDWVANHTSHDAVWIKNHPEWYVRDSLNKIVSPFDWTDVAKLNYNNSDMRKAMIESMAFWVKETDIDGFRCDVAGEVPVDFWEKAVSELKKIKPDMFFLAEAEKPELQKNAFDAYYSWDLHHRMNNIAQGKDNVDSLRKCLNLMKKNFPSGTIPMIFTSNHDENSWNGTEFERMKEATKTMAVFSYILPGIPLIYNGQEAGFNRRLSFFEKDSISWNDKDNFTAFYQSLNNLRKTNKALSSPEIGGELIEIPTKSAQNVFALKRQSNDNTVIAIFNFSKKEQKVTIKDKSLSGKFKSFGENTETEMNDSIEIPLKAWEYKVWYK